ncbi:MAG TPA: FAD-dependent monooxygenase [Marinagarivorans sp.]
MQDLTDQQATSACIGVVGGGMVGAMLALLIARHVPAVAVTLFDRHEASVQDRPSFDRRSTAIAPSTEQCFRRLGLWPALAAHATAIEHIHVSDKGHAGMAWFDLGDNAGQPLGHVIDNAGMGQVLLAALAAQSNVKTVQASVSRVAVTGAGASICTADAAGAQQVFDLVIIADGAQSLLREQLGVAARRIDYQQHAIVANVRHELAHQLQAFERFTNRGPIALLPRGGNARSRESALVWTCPSDELGEYQALPRAELLTRLQKQFGYRLGRFSAISEAGFYPLELIVAQEQVRSNIVLMGNAAHFLHPVAGQGFNLSVRDGLRLVSVLKNAQASAEPLGDLAVLQRYEQQQHADQRNTITLSHNFNRIFTRTPLPVQLMRTLGLISLELNPQVRAQFIKLLSGRGQPAAS